jgi:hypothetical protein
MNTILVLIVLVVLGGGGFYLFKMEQARAAEEKRIADIEAKLKDTNIMMYSECDYLGTEIKASIKLEEGEAVKTGAADMDPMVKSMIIPEGYTVDTYTKPAKGGVKISYSGPTTSKCLSTPIPYIEWRKEQKKP